MAERRAMSNSEMRLAEGVLDLADELGGEEAVAEFGADEGDEFLLVELVEQVAGGC
jgi:hypothetical protein